MDLASKFASGGPSGEAHRRYLNSLGRDYGNFLLGTNTTRILFEDPKMLLFILARHKFVSRVLRGSRAVLEIGCQEGFGSLLVKQSVEKLVGVDFYAPYIDSCRERINVVGLSFECYDILAGPFDYKEKSTTDENLNREEHIFDGAFALDVLEHIDAVDEVKFLQNVCQSLKDSGIFVCGMPSLESQKYASQASLKGHVNCKTGAELSELMEQFFTTVLMFSMNDEVLHTGFFPMSSYLFAVGVSPIYRQ